MPVHGGFVACPGCLVHNHQKHRRTLQSIKLITRWHKKITYNVSRRSWNGIPVCFPLQATIDYHSVEGQKKESKRASARALNDSLLSTRILETENSNFSASSEEYLQSTPRDDKKTTEDVIQLGVTYSKGLPSEGLKGLSLLKQDIRYLMSSIQYLGRKPFISYDKEEIILYYNRRPLVVAVRMITTALPLLVWYTKLTFDKLFGRRSINMPWRARELVDIVMKMGPTYIKIAQALSSRPDILGPLWIKEVEKLVDQVEPFASDWACRLIQVTQQMNPPLDKMLCCFSEERPKASASLGQVYQGLYKREDNHWQKIAVKVQRPGLLFDVPLDLYILRLFAGLAQKQFKLRSNLVGILDDYAQQLFEEMDYQHEADNCRRFWFLYRDFAMVTIPQVYFSSHYMIVLEWIDGEKPPWGSHARSLVRTGIEFSLHQLLDVGFYHADPHSGNLLRTVDNRLAYLDYGMVRYISEDTRWHLMKAIVDFVNRDFDSLIDEFVFLEFLPFKVDQVGMIQALENAFQGASTNSRLSKLNFSKLAQNLGIVAKTYPFRIPTQFASIIRCLTMLEGLALQVDPNFHIVEEAYPFIIVRLFSMDSSIPKQVMRDILMDRNSKRIRWHRLWQIMEFSGKTTDKEEAKITTDTYLPVIMNGQEMVVSNQFFRKVTLFLLSDQAVFLRNGLIEELADILDDLQLVIYNSASVFSMGLFPRPRDRPNRERMTRIWQWIQNWIQTKMRQPSFRTTQPLTIEEWLVMSLFEDLLSSSGFPWWIEAQRACQLLAGRLIEKNNNRIWEMLYDVFQTKG
eukprot:jgi/Galph1/5102/GphlegSOOS_G3781.1